MDYEKLHKDTINKLQGMVNSGKITVETARGICTDFVAESEDERIRKELIDYFSGSHATDAFRGIPWDRVVAWLEKQGEQKSPKYSLEQAAGIFLDALSLSPYNNKPITDAQIITKELLKFLEDTSSYNPDALVEQKPVEWSEEDENIKKAFVSRILENYNGCSYLKKGISEDRAIDWLKSLKDRYLPQPKQEWSEEDEWKLNEILKYFEEKGDYRSCWLSWLKSLRPQKQWKPSLSQLNALGVVVKGNAPDDIEEIKSLYNDLKKLREE